MTENPAALLREARTAAGLSQRELARLAGTAQSVVARIESDLTSPSFDTLARLLEAAGFELTLRAGPRLELDPNALADVGRILRLTPEDRLNEVRNVSRFVAASRRD